MKGYDRSPESIAAMLAPIKALLSGQEVADDGVLPGHRKSPQIDCDHVFKVGVCDCGMFEVQFNDAIDFALDQAKGKLQ